MCAGDDGGAGGAKREACVRTPVSRLFSYRATPAPAPAVVNPAVVNPAGAEQEEEEEEEEEEEQREEEEEEVVVVVEPQVSQVPEVIVVESPRLEESEDRDDDSEKESQQQQQQEQATPRHPPPPQQPQPQKSETEIATSESSSSSSSLTLLHQPPTDEEEVAEEAAAAAAATEEVEVVSESSQSTAPPTASTPSSPSSASSGSSPSPSPPPSNPTPPTQKVPPPPPETPPQTPPPRPPSPLFPTPPPPTAAMVRNIVVLGGSSHPELVATICHQLGIPNGRITLSKFAVGETRVEIQDSVRGKDVFVIQSGCGRVNDGVIELLITISACKTASAKRVTAVLPHFPYSRQSDIPYNKVGAPLTKAPANYGNGARGGEYTFESRPGTPGPVDFPIPGVSHGDLEKGLSRLALERGMEAPSGPGTPKSSMTPLLRRSNTAESVNGLRGSSGASSEWSPPKNTGYKQWVAQAGTLVADLLTCAGADHIITMDLHDPQYQGFFDIPVDNLYGRPLLQRYIKYNIPDYQNAVIVSPDAGGAKRATAIADALGMEFALIHKERRPTRITDRQNATMMLVGDIAGKVAILVDDMADTSNTITRAAKLLKGKGGATKVYALVTHGVFSGDAIERINASALDRVVTTNTVPQDENRRRCHKLEVLDVGEVFAEAVRRVHHGESISVLFRNE